MSADSRDKGPHCTLHLPRHDRLALCLTHPDHLFQINLNSNASELKYFKLNFETFSYKYRRSKLGKLWALSQLDVGELKLIIYWCCDSASFSGMFQLVLNQKEFERQFIRLKYFGIFSFRSNCMQRETSPSLSKFWTRSA